MAAITLEWDGQFHAHVSTDFTEFKLSEQELIELRQDAGAIINAIHWHRARYATADSGPTVHIVRVIDEQPDSITLCGRSIVEPNGYRWHTSPISPGSVPGASSFHPVCKRCLHRFTRETQPSGGLR